MKDIIIQKLPAKLFILLKGYGWYGNFATWDDAKKLTTGYECNNIVDQVRNSLLKVVRGEAVYERDSVVFDKIEYSWELISTLLFIASQNKNSLNMIDFGGSLGSTYFQNRFFLDSLRSLKWNVVEQQSFVKEGRRFFENDILKFYTSVSECISNSEDNINAILFSSVLPYLEAPYDLLDEVFKYKIKYVIIDRTGFTLNDKERITVQKVPSSIYRASYPCRFFARASFLKFFENNGYELMYDFDALDKVNIPSKYKGFVFRYKENA